MGTVGSTLGSTIANSALTSSSSSSSSGNGIDVTGTVNQILAADRAPEQIWMTEQATFSAQVSALQGINSDLQDLQTQVNALNDFQGALGSNSVSVSNSSILTATAAAGATTGTHTIIVGSLATTSSYYTGYQTAISTSLSAGSFSLQIGSNAPTTISVTAATSYYSGSKATSSTPLSLGSFSLQVGSNTPVTITVDNTNNTLDGLATSINNQNLGVTASVITDSNGAHLSLLSNTSGQAGDLTISNDTVGLGFTKVAFNNTLDKLAASINNQNLGVKASVITDASGSRLGLVSNTSGAPGDLTISGDTVGLGFTKIAGTNASLTVDGVPVSSASNTVSVIPGVTLNLQASSASPVTINVQPDTTQATQAINSFVNSYNKIIGDINAQFKYNANTKTAGVLSGNSTLQLLQQQLFSSITASVSGGNQIKTLASLGVNANDDGTLTVDNTKLQSALSSNYQDVQNFFQTPSTGLAQNLSSVLTNLTNPANGPISIEIQGLTQSSSDLTDQIQRLEDRLTITQQQLITQYSQINATLEELPLMLAQINAQVGSLSSTKG